MDSACDVKHPSPNRRSFIKRVACGAAIGTPDAMTAVLRAAATEAPARKVTTVRDFLKQVTLSREVVDCFLDAAQPNWAVFDPELGYTLRDSIQHDGVDGAYTIGRYAPGRPPGMRERLTINFADQPCRINTYGNSFTQCHQVSDGETWQEYLAAHLGEPIRNFGVGGYGFYQAYRRLLRTEPTRLGASHVILNLWGLDDHLRSVDAWRWLRIQGWFWKRRNRHMFHANPWVHLRIDPDTGHVVERPNLAPTPEALYSFCDQDYVYETLKDDIVLAMYLGASRRHNIGIDVRPMERMAETLDLQLDLRSAERRTDDMRTLYHQYAFRSSMYVAEQAQRYAKQNGKKLLVLLSYDRGRVRDACEGKPRPDAVFVDFLKKKGIRFVDLVAKHAEDFKNFRLSARDYTKRYYIGHYNPRGNHFFAFAIKDDLVDWLDPKPPAYRKQDGDVVRFEDYLPGS